jgi:transcriptional regulator of arginine metabolism
LKIIELINECPIRTQEHLISLLKSAGVKATQATVSRDIKDLLLAKVMGPDGKFKYVRLLSENSSEGLLADEKQIKILKETVLNFCPVDNLLVVKCTVGGASAACRAFDCLKEGNMLGSIAGDDTILLIFNSNSEVCKFLVLMQELIGI